MSIERNSSPVTVSVVEDDRAYVLELAAGLTGSGDIGLLDQFGSAEEAVEKMPVNPPRIALIDLNLPGMSGVECIARLAPMLPQTLFVVLTSFAEDATLFEALRCGAVGFLLKTELVSEIIPAIREVAEGGSPMSQSIARKVVRHFNQPRQSSDQGLHSLSARERTVLEMLANGLRYKEISGSLQIGEDTVRTYSRRIYAKLEVTSRTEAVARFLRA